ncbi:MAG: YtxH domain-containing protein, partial [Actinobacteria bacterium]|nr:YtxH domain-containing protein [Actinomycetota bacterium]
RNKRRTRLNMEKSRGSSYTLDIMITMVMGLAVGFAAGILLAPKSGKETRKELIEKGEEFVEKGKEGFELTKVKLAEAKGMGEEFFEKSRDAFEKATKTVGEKAGKAKAKVDKVISKGKATAKKVEEALS